LKSLNLLKCTTDLSKLDSESVYNLTLNDFLENNLVTKTRRITHCFFFHNVTDFWEVHWAISKLWELHFPQEDSCVLLCKSKWGGPIFTPGYIPFVDSHYKYWINPQENPKVHKYTCWPTFLYFFRPTGHTFFELRATQVKYCKFLLGQELKILKISPQIYQGAQLHMLSNISVRFLEARSNIF
jgi:hypothetical protein